MAGGTMRALAFILLLCSWQGTVPSPEKGPIAVNCIPYFHFDEVDHYRIEIHEAVVWAMEGNERRTPAESELLDVLIQYGPDSLADTNYIARLESLGYTKRTLAPALVNQLEQIFCEREHPDFATAACVAIWRDILVFRNGGRVTGTAKLCFDCFRSNIDGSARNTHQFGGSGDFAKLHGLLVAN